VTENQPHLRNGKELHNLVYGWRSMTRIINMRSEHDLIGQRSKVKVNRALWVAVRHHFQRAEAYCVRINYRQLAMMAAAFPLASAVHTCRHLPTFFVWAIFCRRHHFGVGDKCRLLFLLKFVYLVRFPFRCVFVLIHFYTFNCQSLLNT